jgi:hypothetical protein
MLQRYHYLILFWSKHDTNDQNVKNVTGLDMMLALLNKYLKNGVERGTKPDQDFLQRRGAASRAGQRGTTG